MISNRKLASAVGAKTARACDNCIRKRARWYCAADDAFLCQSCDSSVHSANPLASRHDRVRLKTASFKEFPNLESSVSDPSWLHGFTRKARTPRNGNKYARNVKSMQERILNLVPEILSDENSNDDENDEEQQLLYQVPRYAETILILSPQRLLQSDTSANNNVGSEYKTTSYHDCNIDDDMNSFHEMLPSEMDLAEFAADVESLLGKGLDEESFDMELGLGLLGVEKNYMDCSLISEKVKHEVEMEFDMASSTSHHQEGLEIKSAGDLTFELKFDYDSSPVSITGGEEDNIARVGEVVIMNKKSEDCLVGDGKKKNIFLNLEYEGVLNAWADRRSPWTNGDRPELDSDCCWPELSMANWGTTQAYEDRHRGIGDGGREARVLRYREKRRTRLFSKKIRYEVRKLNAEKRPRMKGRFVKRSNFATPPFPY